MAGLGDHGVRRRRRYTVVALVVALVVGASWAIAGAGLLGLLVVAFAPTDDRLTAHARPWYDERRP